MFGYCQNVAFSEVFMTQVCQLPKKGILSIIRLMENLDLDVLIGRNLKRIRENHNISHAQLAGMIGTTPQRLSAYETGRDGMGKDYMERICRALQVEPSEFYWTDKTPEIKDPEEQAALDRYRREQAVGVAEDVAKYGEFRISEAKKKSGASGEDAAARDKHTRKKAG